MSLIEQQLKLIDASLSELEKLKKEVGRLEGIRKEIEETREGVKSLPKELKDAFEKVKTLSVSFVESLGKGTKNYIDGNNTLFTTKLSDLSSKIEEFEKEITRLANTDFKKLFEDLQKVFIDQTREDLEKELNKFEEKSKDLQTKITELKKQIERLEQIDLEKHFDILQKTLSEIFGAINAINLTLTNIVQTLTGIVQTLGNIQISLDTNHKEAKQLLNSFSDTTEKHLTDQDKQTTKNVELIESKIKSISEQNVLMKKEIKKNRIIQIVGFTIVIIIFIYMILRK